MNGSILLSLLLVCFFLAIVESWDRVSSALLPAAAAAFLGGVGAAFLAARRQ